MKFEADLGFYKEILARIQRNPWATGSMPTSAESSDDEDNFDAEATENDDEDEGEEAGLNTSFATANEEHDDITQPAALSFFPVSLLRTIKVMFYRDRAVFFFASVWCRRRGFV